MNLQEASTPPAPRSKAGRSPSYPGIPLSEAIERAKVVWEREKRNSAPVAVLMKHWGYSNPKGGRAAVTFAALRKFGLVTDEGSGPTRPAKLTELAVEIIHAPEVERKAAIRRAALMPPIHREFWDLHKNDLPSEDSFKWTLMQRGFTSTGADEFIREYRDTITYAELTGDSGTDGIIPEQTNDSESQGGGEGEDQGAGRKDGWRGGVKGDVMTIPVPIVGGRPVTVEGVFPITEAAWTQFIAVLNAMKPGLVAQPESDDGSQEN